ncbi:DUF4190 domain-containing protein [Streptomyces hokutonensis]|uniref:DUF4190 domain-containing protein n=1 Tax=Streptomyces hokutonensis TaxID=1306990 RepID=A0ABW6M7M5_9ACTN
MGDQTQPDGSAGANDDPWAPPENRPSLDKRAQPPAPGRQPPPQDQPPAAAQPQQPPPQSPSLHYQPTMNALPSDGFAPPASGAPGTPPASGAPGYGPPSTPVGHPGNVGTPPGLPSYGAPGYGPPNSPGAPGMPGVPGMPGGYGYPQGYGWPGMPMAPQNNLGTVALVLGILSCCLFCIYGIVSLVLGIIAVVLGVKGKKRADRGQATNRGQAQAGLITGIVGIILGLAVIALLGISFAAYEHEQDHQGSDSTSSYNSAPSLPTPILTQR